MRLSYGTQRPLVRRESSDRRERDQTRALLLQSMQSSRSRGLSRRSSDSARRGGGAKGHPGHATLHIALCRGYRKRLALLEIRSTPPSTQVGSCMTAQKSCTGACNVCGCRSKAVPHHGVSSSPRGEVGARRGPPETMAGRSSGQPPDRRRRRRLSALASRVGGGGCASMLPIREARRGGSTRRVNKASQQGGSTRRVNKATRPSGSAPVTPRPLGSRDQRPRFSAGGGGGGGVGGAGGVGTSRPRGRKPIRFRPVPTPAPRPPSPSGPTFPRGFLASASPHSTSPCSPASSESVDAGKAPPPPVAEQSRRVFRGGACRPRAASKNKTPTAEGGAAGLADGGDEGAPGTCLCPVAFRYLRFEPAREGFLLAQAGGTRNPAVSRAITTATRGPRAPARDRHPTRRRHAVHPTTRRPDDPTTRRPDEPLRPRARASGRAAAPVAWPRLPGPTVGPQRAPSTNPPLALSRAGGSRTAAVRRRPGGNPVALQAPAEPQSSLAPWGATPASSSPSSIHRAWLSPSYSWLSTFESGASARGTFTFAFIFIFTFTFTFTSTFTFPPSIPSIRLCANQSLKAVNRARTRRRRSPT
ncbi:hypothetical protein JHW43_002691 [Diplocarpon mali]|nr:hypothetical protein JHW43_002691 [Diplocarpon mali]